jgi:hypothetical protein
MEHPSNRADVIGGLPEVDPNCKGCGKQLTLENAWFTDGCPCNTPLGINNMNETRWRLLMNLQQQQSREIERLQAEVAAKDAKLAECRDTLVAVATLPTRYVDIGKIRAYAAMPSDTLRIKCARRILDLLSDEPAEHPAVTEVQRLRAGIAAILDVYETPTLGP